MSAERITIHRTNADKTEIIEQYPKTIASQVYDSSKQRFLNDSLDEISEKLDSTISVVNVKHFGAIGDGETDDTLAIQRAIDSIDGGIIYFPNGTYKVSRSDGVDQSLRIINKSNLKITGDKNAKIIAVNIDISQNNFHLIRFTRCDGIEVSGLDFDVTLTGNPSTRTNSRILWFDSTDFNESIVKNVRVTDNKFRIKHNIGSSSVIATYGVLFTGYNGYIGENFTIDNNIFSGIDGRNVQLDNVRTCKVLNNTFEDMGSVFLCIGVRILNGSNGIIVDGNIIQSALNGNASADYIQIQNGNLEIEPYDITIVNNTIECRMNNQGQYGIHIRGANRINISNNILKQTYYTLENTNTYGISIEPNTFSNREITIVNNRFEGWLGWAVYSNDPQLTNSYASLNRIGRSIRNLTGRDFSVVGEGMPLINNWLAIRNEYVSSKNRRKTLYVTEKPIINTALHQVGDEAINLNPEPGNYERWIVVTNQFNNRVWRGVGLIEAN